MTRTVIRLVLSCALVLLAPQWLLAQAITVPSLPASLTVTWDDPSVATAHPDTYTVTIDTLAPISVPATKATPCIACASVPFAVTTTGSHTIRIVSSNVTGASTATYSFPVSITIGLPAAVTNVVLAPAVTPPPPDWTLCALEGATCAFTGSQAVRFGANGVYATKTLTGGTPCTNAVFGDPAPGVLKHCDRKP